MFLKSFFPRLNVNGAEGSKATLVRPNLSECGESEGGGGESDSGGKKVTFWRFRDVPRPRARFQQKGGGGGLAPYIGVSHGPRAAVVRGGWSRWRQKQRRTAARSLGISMAPGAFRPALTGRLTLASGVKLLPCLHPPLRPLSFAGWDGRARDPSSLAYRVASLRVVHPDTSPRPGSDWSVSRQKSTDCVSLATQRWLDPNTVSTLGLDSTQSLHSPNPVSPL